MPQVLREAPLSTRTARCALKVGVHWRSVDPDIHLGYRKGKRGGRWLARWYDGAGRYCQTTLGTADDVIDEGNLSFHAAVNAARDAVVAARQAAALAKAGPIVTVHSALDAYIVKRNQRASAWAGREVRSSADHRLCRHVLSDSRLAEIPLHKLTETDLATWRAGLSGKIATRRRLTSDFRAALNEAARAGRRVLPPELASIIKYGLLAPETESHGSCETIARENQILTDEQVRHLLLSAARIDDEKAWEGDLWRMVLVLAGTGARFSQIARLKVGDVGKQRIFMPSSRKGSKQADKYTPVPIGLDVADALIAITEGRGEGEPLLQRWYHKAMGNGRFRRDRRTAWAKASDITRPFQMVAEAANLPNVTTYSLRHTSIVRGLRAGLPIRLVAALHDTSTLMIERYYARYIADGLEELAAKAIVPLVV